MESLFQKNLKIESWPFRISVTGVAYILILSLGFTGCNKNNELPGPFEPIDDPDQISSIENLGSGYDVFEKFADASKVKAPILDYKMLNSDGLIEMKNLEQSTFHTTSGTSISQYTSSLGVSVGLQAGYMFFSGSVTTNFSKERYEYDSYSFATYHCLINKYQLRLPTDWDAEDLKPYLTSQAKIKLNDPGVPAATIFGIYGTHVLTGVVVGGRLDYSISGRTRDVKTGVSVGIYAEASFSQGLGSGSLNTSVITQQEFNNFESHMEKHLEVYGGDSELGQQIISKNDYDAWINSIPNKLVFCNYTQNGLIPVWQFCDDATRKAQLEAAYATWATDRAIAVHPAPRVCILDLIVIPGLAAANPYTLNNRDYYRLDYDLNAGCGGSTPYIWIYYLPGMENDTTFTPIAKVATLDTSDGETLANLGAGFVVDGYDLNKGAGGDLIYLAFRRRTGYSDDLVTGLRVTDNSVNEYTFGASGISPTLWHAVTQGPFSANMQDLNEGAGGALIHLYYTHEFIDESSLPGK